MANHPRSTRNPEEAKGMGTTKKPSEAIIIIIRTRNSCLGLESSAESPCGRCRREQPLEVLGSGYNVHTSIIVGPYGYFEQILLLLKSHVQHHNLPIFLGKKKIGGDMY